MTQGVYKLTNGLNDKVYIGSSTNIENRFRKHIEDLMWNRHHSYRLQNLFNDNRHLPNRIKFSYDVLEDVENADNLIEVEDKYIVQYNSIEEGFNTILASGMYYDKGANVRVDVEYESNLNLQLKALYKGNLILSERDKPYYTLLHRMNKCIEYFVSNYNLNDYVCRIKANNAIFTFDVHGIHSSYFRSFRYNKNTNDIELNKYIMKKAVKDRSRFYKKGTGSKLNYIEKARRRYLWLMNRLANLDKDIIKHNTNKSNTRKIIIPIKTIRQEIDYYEDEFFENIASDFKIRSKAQWLKIKYEPLVGMCFTPKKNKKNDRLLQQ